LTQTGLLMEGDSTSSRFLFAWFCSAPYSNQSQTAEDRKRGRPSPGRCPFATVISQSFPPMIFLLRSSY